VLLWKKERKHSLSFGKAHAGTAGYVRCVQYFMLYEYAVPDAAADTFPKGLINGLID